MTTPLAVENPVIRRQTQTGDIVARWVVTLFAASILLVTALLVYQLWATSAPSRHKSGFGFLFSSQWNPVTEEFGALPFIFRSRGPPGLAAFVFGPVGWGPGIFPAEPGPRSPVECAHVSG